METNYDWDRLTEPPLDELNTLNARLWEIFQIELVRQDIEEYKIPYLDELADCAYIDLLNMASKHQRRLERKPTSKEFNEFRVKAIQANMPVWTRTCTPKDYTIVFKEIASKLGKLLAAARKRNVERRELRNKLEREKSPEVKKAERNTAKLRKTKGEIEARDVLLHGTHHGEFILEGIHTRRETPMPTRKRTWTKIPVRKEIPRDEQLGSLIIETEVYERRQKQIKAFGRVIED